MSMERLNKIREEIATQTNRKAKLEGELQGLKSQRESLENECKEKFDSELSELPVIIDELKKESEEKLSEAEQILGLA